MRFHNILLYIFSFICPAIAANDHGRVSVISFWEQENQQIEGFGVAQAGWADQLFLFKNRHQVLDAMFGENGLRLNILRGEVFPHYSTSSNSTDFRLVKDTVYPDSVDKFEKDKLVQIGQLWLCLAVAKHYHVDKFIFSTWSPPAWMKTNQNVSGGKLEEKHYQSYADYLCDFYEAYQSQGIKVYGISPSNEPGYAAPWNSCLWTAGEMGKFAAEFLGPTFVKRKVKAKMILGENPLWSVKIPLLSSSSSVDFVQTIVKEYPDVLRYNPIFAGHGYTLPDTIKQLPANMLETPIVPLLGDEDKRISTWVTEISDITPLDKSMEDGLKWAKTFHDYLSCANVNAIVWWAGAQPTSNNESLIILDDDREHFSFAKRYDIVGNYSRYIPVGSVRLNTICDEENIHVTSYKWGNKCVWVIINDTNAPYEILLGFDESKKLKDLYSYSTNKDMTWQEKEELVKMGNGLVTISAKSVVTYIGTIE